MIKRKLILVIIAFILPIYWANSQTVVWGEYFQNSCAADCPGAGYNGGNGPWTVSNTGTNGADANLWYVSGAECGNAATQCGTGCGATDPSLHIGSNGNIFGDQGAAYLAGGAGFFDPLTDARVESPAIDLTGQSVLTITFNYIENGQATTDDATLWYFDGATWTQLNTLAKTVLCGVQGTWTSFSLPLPASANNNPNVKIGFRWVNNDDNVGTDPSFAVDDIEITTPSGASPPIADFSAPITTICEGTCLDFTNLSTFATNPVFSWDFGNTTTSSLQNPTGICFNTPGNYTVTLIVTDDNGTDTEAKVSYITVNSTVSAGADNVGSVCNTSSNLNLATLLSGAAPGGIWAETTVIPSGQFNSSTAIFSGNGLALGDYTFSYTVASVAPCPSDVASFTVTVNECTNGPTAIITASDGIVCQGQSLIFNSASIGVNINTYAWSFGGGFPGFANSAGPHSVIFNTAGNYNVWLEVSDDNGTHDTTITIQVIPCSTPTAAFQISDSDPCSGDCILFTNNSSSISTPQYSWTFEGGLPPISSSTTPPQVCYFTPGTYNVTLVVTNSFGTSSYSQDITVLPPPDIIVYNDATVDIGDTVVIGAITTNADLTWSWSPSNQGTILDCSISDCSEALVYPVITTIFTATATTDEGCTASDFVTITVDIPTNGYAIGVPNSFSPNDDNRNDVLYVDGLGMTDIIFRIYNRYGQLVFESLDQSIGWDGTLNQEPLNPATFAWTLEYNLVNGQAGKMNGNVTLLK